MALNEAPPKEFAVPGTGTWPRCRVLGPPQAHASARFARELIHHRDDSGSNRALARTCGVDVNTIIRATTGTSWINSSHLLRICAQLRIDITSDAVLRSYAQEQFVSEILLDTPEEVLVNDTSPAQLPDVRILLRTVQWALLPPRDLGNLDRLFADLDTRRQRLGRTPIDRRRTLVPLLLSDIDHILEPLTRAGFHAVWGIRGNLTDDRGGQLVRQVLGLAPGQDNAVHFIPVEPQGLSANMVDETELSSTRTART